MKNYHFENYYDLARLPFFRLEEGRLVIDEAAGIGPIIDMHTHLALAYLLPMQINLFQLHGKTEHLLPDYAHLDLNHYANKDYTPKLLKRMHQIVAKQSFSKKGAHKTHNVAHLIREMDDLGVQNAVILPVDLPFISNNAKIYAQAAQIEKRLIPFGCVHPFSWFMEKKLDAQIERGAKGIKMHPMAQNVRPNHRMVMKLYRLCGERNIPVLWHCGPTGIESHGGRERCQVRHYHPAIAQNPRTTFILGHSGALQMDFALKLAKRYPNTYCDLSCQSLPNIRKIVEEMDPDRIVYGTDWPWYHEALTLAKVLIATEEKPELRRKILYENAKNLLNLA